MWETARTRLRDWYIVIIAIVVIGGGFFLASHQSSSTAPAAAVELSRALAGGIRSSTTAATAPNDRSGAGCPLQGGL